MRFLTVLLLLLSVSSIAAVDSTSEASVSKIIPDPDKYKDFLLEPYKPGAPSVVAFKDPYCGYCIRALQHLDKLSDYNVYMFWAGILGERSVQRVDNIFDCAAPLSQTVFDSVIKREQTTKCEKGLNYQTRYLRALNAEMVNNYQPTSVPSYHFGGRKVYVSQLDSFKRKLQMNITPIQLQWARYEALKVSESTHQGLGNAIVFLPKDTALKAHVLKALKKEPYYNWYLVELQCRQGTSCSELEKRSEELRLLMDVKDTDAKAVVINGTVITPNRYKQYFGSGLATMLYSK